MLYLVPAITAGEESKAIELDCALHADLTNHLRLSLTMSMRLADQLGFAVPAALVADALGWVEDSVIDR